MGEEREDVVLNESNLELNTEVNTEVNTFHNREDFITGRIS